MKKMFRSFNKIVKGKIGLTLAEILVAMTIFVIAATVAFVIYNLSRESFKKGELAADQQQNTRVGFDELVAKLRLAGYNTHPIGSKVRPDEQIEGAWDTVITIRGDYDFEDPTANTTPESTLVGTYDVVSTGNDEIVTYALGKESGTGGANVQFFADVGNATRDGNVEAVTIQNVAVTQDDPPYVLYKISLNNDSTTYGNASFFVKQPIADNIKSLAFKYYDENETLVAAPGGAEGNKDDRADIRRIEIELIGMTQHPDQKWEDPNDSDLKTKKYRKFNLTQDISPRNLGKFGVPDIDLTPPTTPTNVTACAGHCEGMLIKWDANDPNEVVDHYQIRFGTSSSAMDEIRETFSDFIYMANLSNGTLYYFSVAALDISGNRSAFSTPISETVRDDVSPTLTTPAAVDPGTVSVSGHGASEGLEGRIELSWGAVTQNANALACDPASPIIRDLKGYRIYKDTSASFTPDAGNMIADENTIPAETNPQYTDFDVVNCRNYYYNITAVDKCGNESAALVTPIQGKASSNIKPRKPINVNATRIGMSTIRVTWDPVTQDTDDPPNTIMIDNYKIHRVKLPVGHDPWIAEYTYIGNSNTTEYIDSTVDPEIPGHIIYYRISALDDCPNESEMSDPSEASCPFDGVISIDPPDGTQLPTGIHTITVSVAGSDTYTECRLQIMDEFNVIVFDQTNAGAPPYSFNWDVTVAGKYTASATVENTQGCVKTATAYYTVVPSIACCISASNPNYNTAKGKNKFGYIYWEIVSACGQDLDIYNMEIYLFEDNLMNGKNLLKVYYPYDPSLSFDEQPDVVYCSGDDCVNPPGDPLPVKVSFNDDPRPPLFLDDANNFDNPLIMGLLFDKTLMSKTEKDILAVIYDFRYRGEPSQGTCDLIVEPVPE
jgi:hypothetical protein